MNSAPPVLAVEGACKRFARSLGRSMRYGFIDVCRDLLGISGDVIALRPDEFWAVRDLTFSIEAGACLGLIGPNGAGKSTALKLLNGLIMPDSGRVRLRGSTGALIEVGAGFHPLLTGRENIYINASILGMSRSDTRRRLDEIVEFSGLAEFIDTPVKFYSSGMYVRLGFSIAAHVHPDILLVDEILAVGDGSFQRKCIQKLKQYMLDGGTIVLVSHNLYMVQSICDRVVVMDKGSSVFDGQTSGGVEQYYKLQRRQLDEALASRDGRPASKERSPAVIDRVTVEGDGGGELVFGRPARIRMRVRAERALGPLHWGFSLWSGDQTVRVTTCTSRFGGAPIEIGEGETTLECCIPLLSLCPGEYALKAGIYEVSSSWPVARIGWEDTAVAFHVATSGTEEDNRHLVDGDLVSLQVKWTE